MTLAPVETHLPRGPVGQATAIEQSRAQAEVQAAVVVAQNCPRDVQRALDEAIDSCKRMKMAERAFYSFPRGGKSVNGPSVYLARELARCWGNIQYGLAEMRRDDVAGESEMMVFAWDVQTNARSQHIFIVKHARDVKRNGQAVRDPLFELRDIYENNANHGARRLREAIMAVLPQWFVEEAKERCWQTLKEGDGKPLPLRIRQAVEFYESTYQLPLRRLEDKVGRPRADWTDLDVAQLLVMATSLKRGETTLDEAFPHETKPIPAAVETLSKVLGADVQVIPQSRLKVYNADGTPQEQPAETAAEPAEKAEPHDPTGKGVTEPDANAEPDGWPTVAQPGKGRTRKSD